MPVRSAQRMEAVAKVIEGLRNAYPDAKKVNIDITFEWLEPVDANLDSELCPRVKVDIER